MMMSLEPSPVLWMVITLSVPPLENLLLEYEATTIPQEPTITIQKVQAPGP